MKTLYDKQKENIQFQTELLCAILNNANVYISNINTIQPEYFTEERRFIFDAYTKLINLGRKPDAISVSEEANISIEKVLHISSYFTGTQNTIDSLISELYEYTARNTLTQLAGFISQQVQGLSEIEEIKSHISKELRKLDSGGESKIITMQDGVEALYRVINNNRKQISFTGSPVGLSIVDKHMGGLQPGDLIILAGEVSHGKTSLAMTMLYNSAVNYGVKCGFISHEMTTEQIMARFAAYSTGLSAKYLLVGKLYDSELDQFNRKISGLISSNIFIQDYISRDLNCTVNAIRLMVMQKSIKWIVVENAGNIAVKGRIEDEARTAEISKTLKALALELNITVILISHLNRDSAKKQPGLNRLRHSGQLEADADVVMFVWRPSIYGIDMFEENGYSTDNRAKVYIAKGRNYGLGQSFPYFDEQTTYFTNDDSNTYKQDDGEVF